MHVFISYAKEDHRNARSVFDLLIINQIPAWLDSERLLPGQNWKLEIQKAIENCDAFIACLSKASVSKRGFVQAELKEALEVVKKIPEDQVFIIPVRFEPCEVPRVFSNIQWVDYFSADGPSKLISGIKTCFLGLENRTTVKESTIGDFSIAEKHVLEELRGKPDVNWTSQLITQTIKENRPYLGSSISELRDAVESLIEKGYLLRDEKGRHSVTNLAIKYYREKKRTTNWGRTR